MSTAHPNGPKGRGSWISPKNRFEHIHLEDDLDHLVQADDETDGSTAVITEYTDDDSQSIVSENSSPDVFFRYSVNPYRGCAHGCSYCYARPTHEYLGMNAGIDFESKILVKRRAPKLLRDWLARPQYRPEIVVFSGVTDCYQPAERDFELTRGCLEVALEARQPIGIITKNALVTRDIDLLAQMAAMNLITVSLSITTLDSQLARIMEPRTSSPAGRLRAISELRDANVPTGVMIAPVIPGLNDSEVPSVLRAARDAGAVNASYVLLRLPLTVEPVFFEWLGRTCPDKASRVLSRVKETRDGEFYDSKWGERMRGTGEIANQIRQTFRIFAKKYSLDGSLPDLDCSQFQPPGSTNGQKFLF